MYLGEDKQKRLLEQPNTGHFNMVRALHLADLITLLNGTTTMTTRNRTIATRD